MLPKLRKLLAPSILFCYTPDRRRVRPKMKQLPDVENEGQVDLIRGNLLLAHECAESEKCQRKKIRIIICGYNDALTIELNLKCAPNLRGSCRR